ncbi:MAG: FimV/HubP family polar landmark protein [Sedimenticola sp.]
MITRNSLLALLLLLAPTTLLALGLSDINVRSALNEPLKGRIDLISLNPSNIDGVKVRLADIDVFNKAGVERPYHLSKLRFRPMVGADGKPYINVTTRTSVREPYLNFLVEVIWPGGTMVREYTVLLDPPVVRRAVARVAAPTPKAVPAAPKAVQEKPQPETFVVVSDKEPEVTPGQTYKVRRSETLWVIADKTRAGSDISVEQQMMALQRVNPDAFRRNNVNMLKAGALLDLPAREEALKMNRREARTAFRQQTRDWKAMRAGRPAAPPAPRTEPKPEPVVAPKPEEAPAPAEAEKAPEPPVDESRLQVVETGKELPLEGTQGEKAFPVSEEERLKAAIVDSTEDLEAVKEINQDLDDLRDALEEKIAALRKSLEQKNKAIEDLRQQLESAGIDSEPAAEATAEQPPVVEAKVETPAGVATEAPPVKQPEPAKPEPKAEEEDFWNLAILLGIGLFALIIIVLMVRRNSSKHEELADVIDTFQEEPEALPEEKIADDFLGGLFEDEEEEIAEQPVEAFPEEQEPKRGTDVASVLTEADIYLAYRRYSQSESLVQDAMKDHPESLELKLKMLEIYSFKKDRARFGDYLDEIHPLLSQGPQDLLDRAMGLARDLVPDHPLLGGRSEPAAESLDELEGAYDDAGEDSNLFSSEVDEIDISIDELILKDEDSVLIKKDDEDEDQEQDPGEREIPSLDLGDDDSKR